MMDDSPDVISNGSGRLFGYSGVNNPGYVSVHVIHPGS